MVNLLLKKKRFSKVSDKNVPDIISEIIKKNKHFDKNTQECNQKMEKNLDSAFVENIQVALSEAKTVQKRIKICTTISNMWTIKEMCKTFCI